VLDRASLGQIVFADPKRLAELEALVHPAVFVLAQEQLADVDAPVVVIEAIKLLESGRLLPLCDEIWVVTADESTQLRRLTQQRGMDAAEARRRMAAQSSPAEKLHLARQQSQRTRVIDNNGSEEALLQQLDRIWDELAFRLETQR
jgi:dephospho-CoA kinase